MASVYETIGTFTLSRLRSLDAAYLRGATRPPARLPDPILLAEGPAGLQGPVAGAVGAGEYWIAGVDVPAAPEVCWVLIGANYVVKNTAAVNGIITSYLSPRGDPTDGDELQSPIVGIGENVRNFVVSSAGTNRFIVAPHDPNTIGSGQGLWVPMDPANTKDGWQVVHMCETGAGGLSTNTCELNLLGVRFLGFPSNLWGTGALWSPAAARGT